MIRNMAKLLLCVSIFDSITITARTRNFISQSERSITTYSDRNRKQLTIDYLHVGLLQTTHKQTPCIILQCDKRTLIDLVFGNKQLDPPLLWHPSMFSFGSRYLQGPLTTELTNNYRNVANTKILHEHNSLVQQKDLTKSRFHLWFSYNAMNHILHVDNAMNHVLRVDNAMNHVLHVDNAMNHVLHVDQSCLRFPLQSQHVKRRIRLIEQCLCCQ